MDFGGAGVPGRCGGWQRDFLRRPGPGCELAGPVCPGLACVCAVPGFAAAPGPWLARQGGVAVQAPGGLAGVVREVTELVTAARADGCGCSASRRRGSPVCLADRAAQAFAGRGEIVLEFAPVPRAHHAVLRGPGVQGLDRPDRCHRLRAARTRRHPADLCRRRPRARRSRWILRRARAARTLPLIPAAARATGAPRPGPARRRWCWRTEIILAWLRHRASLRVPPALDRWLFPSPLLRARGRAEQVQAGVELADHHLGQGLAELVLIGVLADPAPAGGAAGRHCGGRAQRTSVRHRGTRGTRSRRAPPTRR